VSALSPNPPAPAQLDAQALARLRELDPKGENQLVDRVLRAFETSVARLLPQLEAARSSGDRAGIRHVAHTLKSSSASIGALALSQHCATVEALIRENSSDDLQAPLTALVAELDAVRQTIHTMLGTRP
jgi:HPt (histidine-containing phosphotransfer) domain-containing protein